MNKHLKNQIVRRLWEGQNIAYILEDNENFLFTDYKILKSQENKGFVKCIKLLHNGKIKFFYSSSKYKVLSKMLSDLDSDSFFSIMKNIIDIVVDVKNNGFLCCSNLDISLDRIFIDPFTLDVKLIYLPIKNSDENIEKFEDDFRLSMLNLIVSIPFFKNENINRLNRAFINESNSLDDLKRIIHEGLKEDFNVFINYMDKKDKTDKDTLTLESINLADVLRFKIYKQEFIIGKNPLVVNGVIPFNNAISKMHCKIIYHNNTYFVEDLGSVNWTYVDNKRVMKNQMYPLKNGNILKMANVEFLVKL